MSQVYLIPSNILLTKNCDLDPICNIHAKSSGILSTRGWFTFKTRPCHPPFKTFRTLQWGLWIQFLELFVDVPKKCYWSPFLSFWFYNSMNFLFYKFFELLSKILRHPVCIDIPIIENTVSSAVHYHCLSSIKSVRCRFCYKLLLYIS